jgi:hypothetical protein
MEIKPMSEADALRAAKRTLLKPGIHPPGSLKPSSARRKKAMTLWS